MYLMSSPWLAAIYHDILYMWLQVYAGMQVVRDSLSRHTWTYERRCVLGSESLQKSRTKSLDNHTLSDEWVDTRPDWPVQSWCRGQFIVVAVAIIRGWWAPLHDSIVCTTEDRKKLRNDYRLETKKKPRSQSINSVISSFSGHWWSTIILEELGKFSLSKLKEFREEIFASPETIIDHPPSFPGTSCISK